MTTPHSLSRRARRRPRIFVLARAAMPALAALATVAASCSGGGGHGGGGGAAADGIAAQVPAGTGLVAIEMAGTWEIRAAVVMDTNATDAQPPASGTQVSIGAAAVESIAALSVRRDDLEALLGAPLELYVNQLDGRTVFYAVTFDRRAHGGTREVVALAGGSVNADTIAVEQFTSTLPANGATAAFVRSRYNLVRVASSVQLGAPPQPGAEPLPALHRALPALFGRE